MQYYWPWSHLWNKSSSPWKVFKDLRFNIFIRHKNDTDYSTLKESQSKGYDTLYYHLSYNTQTWSERFFTWSKRVYSPDYFRRFKEVVLEDIEYENEKVQYISPRTSSFITLFLKLNDEKKIEEFKYSTFPELASHWFALFGLIVTIFSCCFHRANRDRFYSGNPVWHDFETVTKKIDVSKLS